MFRSILRRYGIVKMTVGLTVISIFLSLGITWVINSFLDGGPLREGWVIAIIAPFVIAPMMSVQLLQLLSKLDQAEQQLQVLSHTDELTQTYNRRYFMQYIDQEMKRTQRSGGTFSIAILDMDNFKQINDTWGHLIGDQVIRELTEILKERIRQADILARYGGDEFVILFPQTNREQIQSWAERFYTTFAATLFTISDLEIKPSFSLGIAVYDAGMTSSDELLKAADDALYQAKRKGGDRFEYSHN